jgi:3-keto-5-aminohexanoate cleavage enzyme
MNDKAVITCALTGVLTDPKQHHVPVTPEEMAREAKAAFDAGAAVMHVHFRQQGPGKGHLPSWEPELALTIMQAIRDACPGVILNETTGTMGPNISGPLACLRAVKPEIAACNAGSLNYLKVRADGSWAWPPHLFDNPVENVGIVRCVDMYAKNGMFKTTPKYNFVMGVESGMPADPDLLPILRKLTIAGSPWQVTAIGRADIWPLHRRAAELGGHLRTGLEDTFYLPDGSKTGSNGALVDMLARYAREAGRAIASPAEARCLMGLNAA